MASTSKTLANLRRRKQDAQAAYKRTVNATLNKYGKVVQDSFDQGLVSRANLIAKREERETKQQTLRERFAAATSNVLSSETLDFLKQQSNIAAPTLTSIFAGYESARADRANRFEKLLDRRQESVVRAEAADELAFRDAASQRQQQLSARSNIIQSGLAAENVLFKSENDTINTEADFAQADAKILASQQEAERNRASQTALVAQRATLAAQAQTVQNKQALARLDVEIAAKTQMAEKAHVRAVTLAQNKNSFQLERDQAQRTFTAQRDQEQRTFTAQRDQEQRTFTTQRDTAGNTFQRELAVLNNAADTEQARIRSADAPENNSAVNSNLSIINREYETKPTPTPTTTATADETPVVETTPAVKAINARSLNASGEVTNETVVPGQVVPLVMPAEGTAPITDTPLDTEAPVSPISAVETDDFFAQVTADQEDSIAAATASLRQVVAESMPDEVANLGETPTVDQLANLVDTNLEEEDERIASLLKGIRAATAANTTEVS